MLNVVTTDNHPRLTPGDEEPLQVVQAHVAPSPDQGEYGCYRGDTTFRGNQPHFGNTMQMGYKGFQRLPDE